MISLDDIQQRAQKLWDSGGALRASLGGDDLFPYNVPFRKPSAQEWLDDFANLRKATLKLERNSKSIVGIGYSLGFTEVAHQKLGRLKIPERIAFDTLEDLAAYIGETAALERFKRITDLIRSREPRLLPWLKLRPLRALECDRVLPQLLVVVDHFHTHVRPMRYARELGIPGIDSKFIEENRGVLSDWLDLLLPPDVIDVTARGLADGAFERRYGLKVEEPRIRFRWLDRERTIAGSLTDATVPLSQFAGYAPVCSSIIITENKVNFLTFPPSPNSIAIFGGGYAIDLLAQVPWLAAQPLYYWGDLDTHGFAILSRLRGHWPRARSVLMDLSTLLAHRDLWTSEPIECRCLDDLENLIDSERDLYDDLRFNRLGEYIRLEQERIAYAAVEATVPLPNK